MPHARDARNGCALGELHPLKLEAELCMRERLVRRIVERREVGIHQRLLDGDALRGVEAEHALRGGDMTAYVTCDGCTCGADGVRVTVA